MSDTAATMFFVHLLQLSTFLLEYRQAFKETIFAIKTLGEGDLTDVNKVGSKHSSSTTWQMRTKLLDALSEDLSLVLPVMLDCSQMLEMIALDNFMSSICIQTLTDTCPNTHVLIHIISKNKIK